MSHDHNPSVHDAAVTAAVNAPDGTFKVGSEEFPLHDLAYRDYIQFIKCCAPLVEQVLTGLNEKANPITLPGNITLAANSLSVVRILDTIGDSLPRMVQLMIKQSQPEYTVADVEAIASDPFELVEAVMKQIAKNNMLPRLTSFFKQMAAALTTRK